MSSQSQLQLCLLPMQADNVDGAKLSDDRFLRFWVNIKEGCISLGRGKAGYDVLYTWQDENPSPTSHVALSSWDHHLAYRHIQVRILNHSTA
jgi:hypothetical protein